MLNTDLKIFSKASAAKLKSVLPSLIASQQTAYAQNRYIGEAGRLIFDILDISDKLSVDGYLVTVILKKLSTLSIMNFCWSFWKNSPLVIVPLTGSKYC